MKRILLAFLFESRIGDRLLAWLERDIGLMVVPYDAAWQDRIRIVAQPEQGCQKRAETG